MWSQAVPPDPAPPSIARAPTSGPGLSQPNISAVSLLCAWTQHAALLVLLDLTSSMNQQHLCGHTWLLKKPTLRRSKEVCRMDHIDDADSWRKWESRWEWRGTWEAEWAGRTGQPREKWCQAETKLSNSGLCLNWATYQLCHLLAVGPWTYQLAFLGLSFLSYKMGTIIVPTTQVKCNEEIQREKLAHSKGLISVPYHWIVKPYYVLQKSKLTLMAQLWGLCWGNNETANREELKR